MKLSSANTLMVLLLMVGLNSCQSKYTKLVKSELALGKHNDSIFYGLKFGQTKDQFYNICWELNKKKLVTHGPSNNFVQTFLYPQDSTKTIDKIRMLFYARFNPDNKIVAMDIKFSYDAWSLWNKKYTSDKLMPKIKDTLMKWYPGNSFIKTKNNYLVKVDGNRQIQLSRESDRDVSVLIEDLAYKYNNLKK